MKLRVLIAEDELISREHLRGLLEADEQIEIVAECATGRETLAEIRRSRPDVVLLDVRMPDLDGFDVVKELPEPNKPIIIFVTASDRFALKAFEVHAADYLLKPFDRERLQTALSRARQRLRGEPAEESPTRARPLERLTIKSHGRLVIIKTSDVDWVEAADNYVELHVGKVTHLMRATITTLVDKLPSHIFARISRSVVANLERIKEIRAQTHGDFLVLLHDGTQLRGSRNYRSALAELLNARGDAKA